MASQTFIFVALPNGLGAGNKLKLSLYLTPRLTGGATLADFPDILNWTQSIQAHGLQFQLACGTRKATVAADKTPLRPDVWQALFGPDTFVEPYQFPDFSGSLIVSYPVRDALAYLKYAYQSFGLEAGYFDDDRWGPFGFLEPFSFREGDKSVLHDALAEMRVEMWKQQHPPIGTAAGGLRVLTATAGDSNPTPPDGIPTTLRPPFPTPENPDTPRDMITRFMLSNRLPPAHHRPPLPTPPAGFAKTLDFHSALSALTSYPSLLRALGLVFDVEIPASLCPNSPTAGSYGSILVAGVIPGFKWQIAPQWSLTGTSYWRDQDSFCAAPAASPTDQAGGTYQPSDVFKGFLVMSPQSFQLVQVDLDGALLKAVGLADNIQNLMNLNNLQVLDETLPSLRSAGISLMANGRGEQLLQSISNNAGFNQSLGAKGPAPRPYNAQDLVRGYRIDIWSSRTGQWHSLHKRTATYRFGTDGGIKVVQQEEGFTQLAAAQPAEDPTRKQDPVATQNNIPQPGIDIYIHERVARWDGWSLSVARPGKALNRSADPSKALEQDPTLNSPVTPFKMTTSFTVIPGSLPELRFGADYRLRARTVDLAGNSLPYNAPVADGFALPADGILLNYLRFEPVMPPIVVLRQAAGAGGSLLRLVIRSHNTSPSQDATPTTETDQRHIAPPRVAERTAEQHGVLDIHGKLNGAAATYQMLANRDKFAIPTQGVGQKAVPLVPGPTLDVGYLPDPIDRGAALRNLPNTPDDTNGRIGAKGLAYAILPDVDVRPGSVTYIDFGARPWPNALAFRLVLVEGTATPRWNAAERVLTVSLPKAGVASVPLSSYLAPSDLDIMGVWGWFREAFEALELNAMQENQADLAVAPASDEIARITRLVLEGGNEMITPATTLTLVHATQQPLGEPTFLQLPVVHDTAAPIFASALRNSFTPITAWRSVGSHDAVLLGGLQINSGSSAKIDLEARWLEVTDDPSLPGPTESVAAQQVETIDLNVLSGGPIYSDPTDQRMVAVYIPEVNVLWFSGPLDTLEGVTNPSSTAVAAPVHRFTDTRHQWVTYTAVATSRFQEYFPAAGLDFTRTGPPLVVDVPSSARPLAPDINYVVPTFGWESQGTTNVKSNVRFGSGLRVYLNRGWYSSGQDELLGVVLWPAASPAPDDADRETYKALFTQWGSDPIWANGALTGDVPSVPAINSDEAVTNFPNAVATASGLTVAETADVVFDVASHAVAYDSGRGLWYCDIEVANLFTYLPFIRLALARYQPHSISGVELSPVVLADFAQLTPDRSAVLSINPANPCQARLFIGGLAPVGPLASVLQVTVETRANNVASDLDWQPAPAAAVSVTEDPNAPAENNALLWAGTILFTKAPPPGQFRVVIRELETIAADAASGKITDPPITAQRLVYAAILPYDYP